MAPGMIFMMGIVEKYFKIHWVSLSRDELLEKYEVALIKDGHSIDCSFSEYKDSEKELITKALRMAMLNFYVPNWKTLNVTPL